MQISYRYWTKTGGTHGKIEKPEDFVVNEIIEKKFLQSFERTGKGVRKITGPYTLFLLRKREMTTHSAIEKVSGEFGLNVKEIGYAGLKDRFAVTSQYII